MEHELASPADERPSDWLEQAWRSANHECAEECNHAMIFETLQESGIVTCRSTSLAKKKDEPQSKTTYTEEHRKTQH